MHDEICMDTPRGAFEKNYFKGTEVCWNVHEWIFSLLDWKESLPGWISSAVWIHNEAQLGESDMTDNRDGCPKWSDPRETTGPACCSPSGARTSVNWFVIYFQFKALTLSLKGTNANGKKNKKKTLRDGEIVAVTPSCILEPEEESGERERNWRKWSDTFFFLLLCVTAKVHRAEFMIFLCGDGRQHRRSSACEENTETLPGSGPEVAEAYWNLMAPSDWATNNAAWGLAFSHRRENHDLQIIKTLNLPIVEKWLC